MCYLLIRVFTYTEIWPWYGTSQTVVTSGFTHISYLCSIRLLHNL